MKRRQGPIRGRYTDQCSAILVWRSSRAWHPHFRHVPPANANLRQQIQPASGTGRQRAGLPEGSCHALRLRQTSSLESEEHTSELQSQSNIVCRLLLEKNKE